MFNVRNVLKSSLIGIGLLAASAMPALAEEPGPVAATADVVLARPVGFIGTVAGAGLWVVTSPFTFINGTEKESFEVLVETPADYTFERPLGEGL